MPKSTPDHQDAELILKLYDLRREPVMRESRKAIAAWLPRSFDDVQAILQPAHPHNPAWRQVSSYFEMAFGFARHGAVHTELLSENLGEGLMLFAKVEPYLKELRDEISPYAFQNAEWVVKHSTAGRARMKLMRKRIAGMLASAAGA